MLQDKLGNYMYFAPREFLGRHIVWAGRILAALGCVRLRYPFADLGEKDYFCTDARDYNDEEIHFNIAVLCGIGWLQ